MDRQVLRLKFTQDCANFRREEMFECKMTYALVPPSTVIGMIHNACGYTEYVDMNVSIQARFHNINRIMKREIMEYNSKEKDRGILVKFEGADFARNHSGYKKISEIFGQGHNLKNFRIDSAIKVYDEAELENFLRLKAIKKPSDAEKEELKKYSVMGVLITNFEELNDIEYVIHIDAEEDVLNNIMENVKNMMSLGRSEDFIFNKKAEFVKVSDKNSTDFSESFEESERDRNMIYIYKDAVKDGYVKSKTNSSLTTASIMYIATVYNVKKKYEIINKKRVFDRHKVYNMSNIYLDNAEEYNEKHEKFILGKDEDGYIVNFI